MDGDIASSRAAAGPDGDGFKDDPVARVLDEANLTDVGGGADTNTRRGRFPDLASVLAHN
jgi:hypothetical protein